LEDDNHWDLTLADAVLNSSPHQIQQLYSMSDDILHRIRTADQDPNIDFSPEIYNEALINIENICILISNMPLIHFGMPSPNRPTTDIINSDVQREHQFDAASLTNFVLIYEQLLTAEQKNIYDRINLSIAAQQGGFFFLDAPGGTGKTFLISLIYLHAFDCKIILCWQLLHQALQRLCLMVDGLHI